MFGITSISRRIQKHVAKSHRVSFNKPMTETLERRCLMTAVAPALLSYDGTLGIGGTDINDTVLVRVAAGLVRVDVTQGSTVYLAKFFDATRVHSISFASGGGNDSFTNETGVPAYVWGGWGNDTITSGNSRDIVYGEEGNDFIQGLASDDYLDGGNGNDTIVGFNGNDTIYGGFGFDSLFGSDGNDWMNGGYNADILVGGTGNDTLSGDYGNDSIWGEAGSDWLYGGYDNDYLNGGQDNAQDVYYGYTGKDIFVTNWRWTGSSWQNLDVAGDYQSWGTDMDTWVNP
jgi:Ca2+-binding RTX toxin-like protein